MQNLDRIICERGGQMGQFAVMTIDAKSVAETRALQSEVLNDRGVAPNHIIITQLFI